MRQVAFVLFLFGGLLAQVWASELIELRIKNPTAYKLTLSDVEKS